MTWRLLTPRLGPCRVLLLLSCLWLEPAGFGAPITLYSTQFEDAQGFDKAFALAGQDGWIQSGSGGNGLTEWNEPLGYGQSAFIGHAPATPDQLVLWKPINHNPTNRPIVSVTFDMSVIDSTNTNRDEFRWSVYNIAGVGLFSLLFDNRDLAIYHQLDDEAFRFNGWEFTNDVIYHVEIRMNFAANLWNVFVGGTQVITNEFITTTNASLTFGDVDAVWLRGDASGAGNNFMVFDNLTITADEATPAPATLAAPLSVGGGLYLIRVNGAEGARYAVQASTNLVNWVPLKTNVISGGYFEYLDTTSAGLPRRFYRARWVP